MRYWNSTFSIKFDAAKTPRLNRSRKAPLRGRGRLNANGRRTKDWRKVWRFLKAEFEKRGRTKCEFDWIPHDCWGRLDPCHSKKRRLMEGVDIYVVAMGCAQIHRILDEVYTHAGMELAVLRAIERNGGLVLPEGKQ